MKGTQVGKYQTKVKFGVSRGWDRSMIDGWSGRRDSCGIFREDLTTMTKILRETEGRVK